MNCLTMCKQRHLYSQLYGIWFYSVFVLLIFLDDFYSVVCTDWLYKFPPICSYVSKVVYHLVAFFRMNNCWLYYFSIIGTCVPSVVSCRYAFFLLLVYYTCNYKIAISNSDYLVIVHLYSIFLVSLSDCLAFGLVVRVMVCHLYDPGSNWLGSFLILFLFSLLFVLNNVWMVR